MPELKLGAVWCRVSGHDQRELSLPLQEERSRRALEERGFVVPREYVF